MLRFDKPPLRKALIVGIANYDHSPPLANTIRDAQAIAAALRKLNFQVEDYYDLDFRNLMVHLSTFLSRGPADQPPDTPVDAMLVYYAGHGLQFGDKNYIVPKDFDPHASYPLSQLVSVQGVLDAMEQRASKKILFLDACRDTGGIQVTNFGSATGHAGPLGHSEEPSEAAVLPDELGLVESAPAQRRAAASAMTRGIGKDGGLAPPSLGGLNQTFIAFAADPGATALDGPAGGHGYFTEGVLRYVDRRGQSVFDMCQSVARHVRHKTDGQQVPWTRSNLMDPFQFHEATNWPAVVLLVLGLLAGAASAVANFDFIYMTDTGFKIGSGQLTNVQDHPQFLLTSVFLGLALGFGTYQWARPKHNLNAALTTVVAYVVLAALSRIAFAPVLEHENAVEKLGQIGADKIIDIFLGRADLSEELVTNLIAVLFFAIITGALAGLATVLSGALHHYELRRATRLVTGTAIGMAAPVCLIAFLVVRAKFAPEFGFDQESFNDDKAEIYEIVLITLLLSVWQGLLAWNVGRAYAKPRYD